MAAELESLVAILRSTTTPLERPDRLPRALVAMAPWGTNSAGLAAAAAARYPDRVAVIDDHREITYRELWRRVRCIRSGLHELGARSGFRVGLMMRNHIGFYEAFLASAATGADVVLVNTGFGGAQLADVIAHEQIDLIVHDDEFAPLLRAAHVEVQSVGEDQLRILSTSPPANFPHPQAGSIVILTSGTTGRPKGAQRSSNATTATGVGGMLERVPLRLGDVQVVAAPLFHAWGFSNLLLGLARCATTVLARRFDPFATRQLIERHRARVLIAVPVMLQRLVSSDDSPLPSLEIIATSGSAIPRGLVQRVQASFGDVLYNLYGSTEVSVATIATPRDLAKHPDTAGRPVLGAKVGILDDDGKRVPDGEVGRVFVGSATRFDGYTGGGNKQEHDGMLASGDLGVFRDGLLYIEGREDDMIVSGGENVYPAEVENLLSEHPLIAEVAVVGVPDDEFGQVLTAFVVGIPAGQRGTSATDPLSAVDVQNHVRTQLARHKVPRYVRFVEALPRNETGKILRTRLADTTA